MVKHYYQTFSRAYIKHYYQTFSRAYIKHYYLYMLASIIKRMTTPLSNQKDSIARLLEKTPKIVEVDVGHGFLALLFEQSKKSPTYLLLKELFVYLQQSPFLKQQFPFLKSESRFQQNWMALHLQILKARLREQKVKSDAINQLELEKYNYNAQVYFFPNYAKYLNPQTPTSHFESHYAEAFLKRFLVFEQHFEEDYERRPSEQILSHLLRKLVYENRVNYKDAELLKLTRYYTAHRCYLRMLEWDSLIQSKIKWGFQTEPELLEELGR